MIVVTGAAGFIASCLVSRLNAANFNDIVVVDNFSVAKKEDNLKGKKIKEFVDRDTFIEWLDKHYEEVEFIFHLGARTDTTEFNKDVFDLLNLNYSKAIWNACCEYQIPLVYASSAATYGSGTLGYDDDEATIPLLKPLNPYGDSKNDFDIWALQQTAKPFFWAGLKFFNVYGPNEYHKGKMASVIFHAYNQIKAHGSMKLFRSHHPDFKDGEQMRDFVYVKDVVEVCMFLMHHRKNSGIYNLGSGQARTFMALALNTFEAMGVTPNIDFMDTPENLRDNYQYFTEANMSKLRSIGYDKPFHSLEEGVKDYVQGYLMEGKYY
ncbi:ADP-glyceromanno-heptose 6-epimerase [Pontibacter sp. BT310]|uniref:ADP-L-glycero-D-manno-heptose-6-epimerase n=1 Tax=Pontibacter populi TaxID=890055 RepID=A0ABS6X6Y1_9BACT|nr:MULTISPECIES: ADP-glyceromanno-heptose 6-epimerase [Pontibacter]MBJ6116910.1 ADP-glyceromanno-heptose 6-epimerase [Pontibacter sp. BT310]MBR0569334.1 ADP-glyceromanno-heptose 6-epimerase [Microvirga sp. STS03]MBW3363763.1 ADP-glyceromanno-heptose 6-epimerase [Pontibacter populi]